MPEASVDPREPELLRDLLLTSSRTFALGIERLRDPLRAEVRIAYLLLRISDYLEDSPRLEPERKARLLELWERILAGDRDPEELLEQIDPDAEPDFPDARVAAKLVEVHAAVAELRAPAAEAILRHVRDSTLGMARWARRGPRFDDEGDLDDYMHEVAGRVGYLLTDLFCLRDPALETDRAVLTPLARSFGLGLQTVNVVRGLHTDPDRGWVYIPRSWLPDTEAPGQRPAALILAPEARALRGEIVERFAEKATRHLDDARSYLLRIPRAHADIRLFCALPLMYAERTLAISRARGEAVFHGEVKMRRPEVRRVARLTALGVRSNLMLRMLARVLRGR